MSSNFSLLAIVSPYHAGPGVPASELSGYTLTRSYIYLRN